MGALGCLALGFVIGILSVFGDAQDGCVAGHLLSFSSSFHRTIVFATARLRREIGYSHFISDRIQPLRKSRIVSPKPVNGPATVNATCVAFTARPSQLTGGRRPGSRSARLRLSVEAHCARRDDHG